jgi:hypothetical protein
VAPATGNPQEIVDLAHAIVRSINTAVDQSTPWSMPSPKSVAEFTKECKEAQIKARRLGRMAKRRSRASSTDGQETGKRG